MRTTSLVAVIVSVATLALACKGDSKKRTHADDTEASSSAPARPKRAQCDELIETINKGSGPIKEYDAKADYEAQAKKVEAFEKTIAGLPLDDAELKKQADAYRKMVRDFATLVRDFKDPSKLEGVMRRTDELNKTESDLVEKINTYCTR